MGIGGAVGAGKGIESPALSFIEQLDLNNFTIILLVSLATLLVTSSIDTLENAIASTISLDILKKKSEEAKLTTLLVVCIALVISIEVTSIFNVFLVADLFAACLVFPAFYRIKKSSKDKLPPINDPYNINFNPAQPIVNIMDPLGIAGNQNARKLE